MTVPVPKMAGDEYFKRLPPFVANEKNEGRNRWRWRFDTPEKYQQYMKAYYRLTTEVDATVGRALAAPLCGIESSGSLTVVVVGSQAYIPPATTWKVSGFACEDTPERYEAIGHWVLGIVMQ